MQVAYLGVFSDIFNWIFDKILSPVIEFVAGILEKAFTFLFENVLEPILNTVFKAIVDYVIPIILELLSGILFYINTALLRFIDLLEESMGFFLGTQNVLVNGEETTLLMAILQMDTISKAFWMITVLGLGIALILTIYSVAKSSLDFDFENKRPVSAVLTS